MKVYIQNINNIARTSGFHFIIWVALVFINVVLLHSFKLPFNFLNHLKEWLLYILLFYINFYLLLPQLLLRKKIYYYIAFSVILITIVFLLKNNLEIVKLDATRVINKSEEYNIKIKDICLLMLVYTASISLRFIRKWQDDEKRKTEIEKEKLTNELSFLKQQINPHFLFNALNNIYSLTLNTSSKASDALLKLSAILRYMLYETENSDVLLKDELNIIADFVDLQKIRITEKVKVKYQITGNPGNLKIAPLLLIPIIENAFKYGIDNVKDSFIEIMVKIESQYLNVLVSNTIVNIRLEKENNTGIGIKNIKRRLDILYPGRYSFDAVEKNSIFNVELKLNLNT